MANKKSIVSNTFDSLPFTAGAAVWFALFALTINPDSYFSLTTMYVNIALSAGYTGRTMALLLRILKPVAPVATDSVEEVTR